MRELYEFGFHFYGNSGLDHSILTVPIVQEYFGTYLVIYPQPGELFKASSQVTPSVFVTHPEKREKEEEEEER